MIQVYIMKIHTNLGYEGVKEVNLAASASKELLQALRDDFLSTLPEIKDKIIEDENKWDRDNHTIMDYYPYRGGTVERFEARMRIAEEAWLHFKRDSPLDFKKLKKNWEDGYSSLIIEGIDSMDDVV